MSHIFAHPAAFLIFPPSVYSALPLLSPSSGILGHPFTSFSASSGSILQHLARFESISSANNSNFIPQRENGQGPPSTGLQVAIHAEMNKYICLKHPQLWNLRLFCVFVLVKLNRVLGCWLVWGCSPALSSCRIEGMANGTTKWNHGTRQTQAWRSRRGSRCLS